MAQTNDITIRPANASDYKNVQDLQKIETITIFEKFWPDESLAIYFADGLSFVAEMDGKFAGFVIGERVLDGGALAHLWAVVPEFRGRGIGEKLNNAFEDACRGMGITWILLYSEPHLTEFHKKRGAIIGKQYTEVLKILD